jgi:hypothetical protein
VRKRSRLFRASVFGLSIIVTAGPVLVLMAWLWNPSSLVQLDVLEGLQPERTHEEKVSSRHWYTTGKKHYYQVDQPLEKVLASVEAQLRPEQGWRRSTVASSGKIVLFAQKLPGDEFYRCTVGVQNGWRIDERRRSMIAGTKVTVAEGSRRIQGLEKLLLGIKETFGF